MKNKITSSLKYLFFPQNAVVKLFMDSGIITLILSKDECEKIKQWYINEEYTNYLINDNANIIKINKNKINKISTEYMCNFDVIFKNIIALFKIQLPKGFNYINITRLLVLIWGVGLGYTFYKNGNLTFEIASPALKALFTITFLLYLSLLVNCIIFLLKGIWKLLLNRYKVFYTEQEKEKFSTIHSLLPNVFIAYMFTFNFGQILRLVKEFTNILQ